GGLVRSERLCTDSGEGFAVHHGQYLLPRSRGQTTGAISNRGNSLILRIEHVSHVYPAQRGQAALQVLQDVDLEIGRNEIVVVLGPSGCGKTTLLNLVAGLAAPTHGRIAFHGERANPHQPLTAVVFQDFALFPWRTVHDNVRYGLEMLRVP